MRIRKHPTTTIILRAYHNSVKFLIEVSGVIWYFSHVSLFFRVMVALLSLCLCLCLVSMRSILVSCLCLLVACDLYVDVGVGVGVGLFTSHDSFFFVSGLSCLLVSVSGLVSALFFVSGLSLVYLLCGPLWLVLARSKSVCGGGEGDGDVRWVLRCVWRRRRRRRRDKSKNVPLVPLKAQLSPSTLFFHFF